VKSKGQQMANNNPTRFHGIALGKEKNFQAETDGLIASADSSPSVSTKSLFWTNNATATTITDFDDGGEGQIIEVIALDAVTTLSNGTILLSGGQAYKMGANDSITLIKSRSNWFEIARSANATGAYSYVSTGSAGNTLAIDIANINYITLNASGGAPIVLCRLVSGKVGQVVNIVNLNSASIITTSGGAACMLITGASSGNYVMTGSDATAFLQTSDSLRQLRGSDV
jgi:hypothetical protein